MNSNYIVVNKKVGHTPLATLEEERQRHSELAGVPMTYAGRLDPMASGKLLLLLGDECKRRSRYDGLEKEYEFEVVFGVATDTGDCLGMPNVDQNLSTVGKDRARQMARDLVGAHTIPYPVFSSKKVNGKPLFQHVAEGTIGDIEVPSTIMRVHTLTYVGQREVPFSSLQRDVINKISMLDTRHNTGTVSPDFRKENIVKAWEDLLQKDNTLTVVTFRAIVGSGTYIRTLAKKMGDLLGVSAFALSIHRTRIGSYIPLPFVQGLWIRTYE